MAAGQRQDMSRRLRMPLSVKTHRRLNRRNKYGARPTVKGGRRFASKGEANWYQDLVLLERAGEISHLSPQPRFPLFTVGPSNERAPILTEKGRQREYRGDAAYLKDGKYVCLDFKGVDTPVSKLKRDILRASGIEVVVVKKKNVGSGSSWR